MFTSGLPKTTLYVSSFLNHCKHRSIHCNLLLIFFRYAFQYFMSSGLHMLYCYSPLKLEESNQGVTNAILEALHTKEYSKVVYSNCLHILPSMENCKQALDHSLPIGSIIDDYRKGLHSRNFVVSYSSLVQDKRSRELFTFC